MNYFFIFLYVLVIIFIRTQYVKYSELQAEIYGSPLRSMRNITEEIILTGLVAGFAGSLVTVASGIAIDPVVVRYLFYIMCLLLIVNIRFLCISYAGGLLSLVALIFNYPKTDVSAILGLVAVLHIIEGLLVYMNRGRDSIPVFTKQDGDITGAYLIRKFWLVPVFPAAGQPPKAALRAVPSSTVRRNMAFIMPTLRSSMTRGPMASSFW